MSVKGKTAELATITSEESEVYELVYTINFNNCTFNGPFTLNQTGSPPDPPDDPPSGE